MARGYIKARASVISHACSAADRGPRHDRDIYARLFASSRVSIRLSSIEQYVQPP
jgi:hypothetical protein